VYSDKVLENKSFTYFVVDYDSKTREYTLQNPITKDIKIMSEEEFDRLYKEQKTKNVTVC